jgi:hypothetical protein
VDKETARRLLLDVLQQAYSGEMAAAFAYRGHWKSVSKESEVHGIQRIEQEEWVHRANIARMLAHLGEHPRRVLEAKAWVIGRALEFTDELTIISAVEKDHEIFFFDLVAEHRFLPLARRFFKWPLARPVSLARPALSRASETSSRPSEVGGTDT